MRDRMNDGARPDDWKDDATDFLISIWRVHGDTGHVFVGTRPVGREHWSEHVFELPVERAELMEFFSEHDRTRFDIYFCANAFEEPQRRKVHARKTPYACVDVDDAELASFHPQPGIAWETSPGRSQAIWVFDAALAVDHAEQIAKDLAYTHRADKNGWSVTKYLRIPFTLNHKPQYSRPEVKLIRWRDDVGPSALPAPPFVRKAQTRSKEAGASQTALHPIGLKNLPEGRKHRLKVLRRYRSQLGLMPRSLLGHETLLYPDRSSAIYAIVAGLHENGASRREIEIAVWNSVYFRDKHGRNRRALLAELARIITKLEGEDDA